MRKKLYINKKSIETTNLQTTLPHEASSASLFLMHQQSNRIVPNYNPNIASPELIRNQKKGKSPKSIHPT
jgi:hypothetical protein